jgi:hypothetical protein
MNSPKLIETTFRNYLVVLKKSQSSKRRFTNTLNVVILGRTVNFRVAVLLLQNENLRRTRLKKHRRPQRNREEGQGVPV